MTTRDKYTVVPEPYSRSFPSAGDARFTWEYDDGRARLLSLYQKGKDKQWDAQSRIDWTQDVDPMNPIGLPDEFLAAGALPTLHDGYGLSTDAVIAKLRASL